jgi:hypothetical protein
MTFTVEIDPRSQLAREVSALQGKRVLLRGTLGAARSSRSIGVTSLEAVPDQPAPSPIVPGTSNTLASFRAAKELLCGYQPGHGDAAQRVCKELGFELLEVYKPGSYFKCRWPHGEIKALAIESLAKNPLIRYVEPNYGAELISASDSDFRAALCAPPRSVDEPAVQPPTNIPRRKPGPSAVPQGLATAVSAESAARSQPPPRKVQDIQPISAPGGATEQQGKSDPQDQAQPRATAPSDATNGQAEHVASPRASQSAPARSGTLNAEPTGASQKRVQFERQAPSERTAMARKVDRARVKRSSTEPGGPIKPGRDYARLQARATLKRGTDRAESLVLDVIGVALVFPTGKSGRADAEAFVGRTVRVDGSLEPAIGGDASPAWICLVDHLEVDPPSSAAAPALDAQRPGK